MNTQNSMAPGAIVHVTSSSDQFSGVYVSLGMARCGRDVRLAKCSRDCSELEALATAMLDEVDVFMPLSRCEVLSEPNQEALLLALWFAFIGEVNK